MGCCPSKDESGDKGNTSSGQIESGKTDNNNRKKGTKAATSGGTKSIDKENRGKPTKQIASGGKQDEHGQHKKNDEEHGDEYEMEVMGHGYGGQRSAQAGKVAPLTAGALATVPGDAAVPTIRPVPGHHATGQKKKRHRATTARSTAAEASSSVIGAGRGADLPEPVFEDSQDEPGSDSEQSNVVTIGTTGDISDFASGHRGGNKRVLGYDDRRPETSTDAMDRYEREKQERNRPRTAREAQLERRRTPGGQHQTFEDTISEAVGTVKGGQMRHINPQWRRTHLEDYENISQAATAGSGSRAAPLERREVHFVDSPSVPGTPTRRDRCGSDAPRTPAHHEIAPVDPSHTAPAQLETRSTRTRETGREESPTKSGKGKARKR